MLFSVYLSLVAALLFTPTNGQDIKSLKQVYAIWRHGERTPVMVFPTDTANGEASWRRGLGQLTSEGVRQAFGVGHWLRRRYDGFLNRTYIPAETNVRSSNYSRTHMTALAVMAGLYPPEGADIWNENVNWQPIPVVQLKPHIDEPTLFSHTIMPYCPSFVTALKELSETAEFIKWSSDNKELIKFLEKMSGLSQVFLPEAENGLVPVFDPLFIEQLHANDSHRWPSWVNRSLYERIVDANMAYSRLYFNSTAIVRLSSGLLLNDILARMEQKAYGATNGSKFTAYSAHDTTIMSLMASFGQPLREQPQFVTTLLIEFHHKDGRDLIEVYIKNGTYDDALYSVNISDCPRPCDMEVFRKRSIDLLVLPKDWPAECGHSSQEHRLIATDSTLFIAVFCALAALVLLQAFALGFLTFLTRRLKQRLDKHRRKHGSRSGNTGNAF